MKTDLTLTEFDKSLSYQVEYRWGTGWKQNSNQIYRYLECKDCGHMTSVGDDVSEVKCSSCLLQELPPDWEALNRKSPYPRGWHLRSEFVDDLGNVYFYGKLQPHLKRKIYL